MVICSLISLSLSFYCELLWPLKTQHVWSFNNHLSTFATPLSYAQGYDIYYTFSVLCKIGFISEHIRGFSQVKINKNAERKYISVISASFSLKQVSSLEDIYQWLGTFLIVTTRGLLLASSG